MKCFYKLHIVTQHDTVTNTRVSSLQLKLTVVLLGTQHNCFIDGFLLITSYEANTEHGFSHSNYNNWQLEVDDWVYKT